MFWQLWKKRDITLTESAQKDCWASPRSRSSGINRVFHGRTLKRFVSSWIASLRIWSSSSKTRIDGGYITGSPKPQAPLPKKGGQLSHGEAFSFWMTVFLTVLDKTFAILSCSLVPFAAQGSRIASNTRINGKPSFKQLCLSSYNLPIYHAKNKEKRAVAKKTTTL